MKTKTRILVLALAAQVALAASAVSAGGARFDTFTYLALGKAELALGRHQYRNPILQGYYPDPSIVRVGADYYLVNSTFAHFPGLPVFKSRDLVNWVQIGNAIDRPGQLDFSGRAISQGAFAPDISFHAGLFFIANTCVGCKGNFFITAKDPAGPWSDPVWLPFEGIDPSIFWDGDRAYIVNNRAPDEAPRYAGHRAIWIQEFDWRHGRMVGQSRQLVNGGVDIDQQPVWIEGPHIFKRGGYYYLTAAEGGTGSNHSQVIFRSRDLFGPYAPYDKNPILTQRDLPANRPNPVSSAGHAKFVQTQNGQWWATFLATRPYQGDSYATGRETFLLPVKWRDNWPVILDPGVPVPLVTNRPQLADGAKWKLPGDGSFSYTEEFDGRTLGPQWIGIRTPKAPFYRLVDGALELGAGAALGDVSAAPAFIGRRLQHAEAQVSTRLRYQPEAEGARAGLAAVQSDRSLLFFGITQLAGKPVVALYTRDRADIDTLVSSAPVDATKPVELAIRITRGSWSFTYSQNGVKHLLKADVNAEFMTTQRAGGFVGTVIGAYSFK